MYNRPRKHKPSQGVLTHNDKTKTIRNSAIKTPKLLETTHTHKSPSLNKFKSVPTKSKKSATHSLLPPEIHFLDQETESHLKTYKTNKTNTTNMDIPYSNSEKTLHFQFTDQNHKSLYKN